MVFLPNTQFPMRGDLPTREETYLRENANEYHTVRSRHVGRDKFVLHDGPPYANGHLHVGHLWNKTLKDMVCRFQRLNGRDAVFVPGWDCHGLPIEWKVEELYRKEGLDKKSVPVLAFRQRCREYARDWYEVQKREFQRFGVMADWDNAYLTMSFDNEALVVNELRKLLMDGYIYRGVKPVLWSPVEETALSEAEVEYRTVTTDTFWVKFPTKDGDLLVWTSAPWTLPGNVALAWNEEHSYGWYEGDGHRLALMDARRSDVESRLKVSLTRVGDFHPCEVYHPYLKTPSPLLHGSFVTDDAGSGFVHLAPGHGEEDFHLCQKHGLPVVDLLLDNGRYRDSVHGLAGMKALSANDALASLLGDSLLLVEEYQHDYPHSWRSRTKVVYRTTGQWFVSLTTLRDKALTALEDVSFFPETGKNRLRSMIENRPDWCLSRQRVWGTPLALYWNPQTGEVLKDAAVMERVVRAIKEHGGDVWWTTDHRDFLGEHYGQWEPVMDVVDVWFDSGCSHVFHDEDADLYLEGSDQHRGWFQSSLLESVATTGRAPFKAVMTHGFTLDQRGMKMSKSLGNVLEPDTVLKQYGADVFRLWVALTQYSDDQKLGMDTLKTTAETYRKVRNTFRYLLGGLDGFTDEEVVQVSDMPLLERHVWHMTAILHGEMLEAMASHRYHEFVNRLLQWCGELSTRYFEVRKDSLYCDGMDSPVRKSCRTTFRHLLYCLTKFFSPVLVFTSQEAYSLFFNGSVHDGFFTVPEWKDERAAEEMSRLNVWRDVVMKELETARTNKVIKSGLDAHVTLTCPEEVSERLLKELCVVSSLTVKSGPTKVEVEVELAHGERCPRCRTVTVLVSDTCQRCHDVE